MYFKSQWSDVCLRLCGDAFFFKCRIRDFTESTELDSILIKCGSVLCAYIYCSFELRNWWRLFYFKLFFCFSLFFFLTSTLIANNLYIFWEVPLLTDQKSEIKEKNKFLSSNLNNVQLMIMSFHIWTHMINGKK